MTTEIIGSQPNEIKMVDIEYKITFYSNWHCGSGLAAGANLDTLVIKDRNNLPYVPGKTVKGLVRETIEELNRWNENKYSDLISLAFGKEANMAVERDIDIKGESFFSNAVLESNASLLITNDGLSDFLYRRVTSTSIGESGVAKATYLRSMQITIPCELEGMILNIPEELKDLIKSSLMMIKRLGHNRNRGLGRCDITIIESDIQTRKGGSGEN